MARQTGKRAHVATPASSAGSLRKALTVGIGIPVTLFIVINSLSLYRQALSAADTAYDRTLLASAKAIGELLNVTMVNGRVSVTAAPSYAALEAFEADNRSRLYYKVSGFDGEMVTGFADLRTWQGELPPRNVYAALVHFYNDSYQGEPVRVAVLLQPVSGDAGLGMATIQVAETLEIRRALARELLVRTIWQQGLLLLVMAWVTSWIIGRLTRPVDRLSKAIQLRAENDLSPIAAESAPRELQPMVLATNDLMERLAHLIEHQKRFVRDTSHQLRTPLAVLKTQVQSALRGDVEPVQALKEIEQTVSGAAAMANQMLSLAKVEQLRQQGDAPVCDWAAVVRAVSLDLSPLMVDKALDFEVAVVTAPVSAHEWMLRELTRNLLHNAIRHSPPLGALGIGLSVQAPWAVLTISDEGPGIDAELRERLFQPFSRGKAAPADSTGLGLSICQEIAISLNGSISLENRNAEQPLPAGAKAQHGLRAVVRIPLVQASPNVPAAAP